MTFLWRILFPSRKDTANCLPIAHVRQNGSCRKLGSYWFTIGGNMFKFVGMKENCQILSPDFRTLAPRSREVQYCNGGGIM
jgi:hypothetical protein